MITLDRLRAALRHPQPWSAMDELVRAEQAAGRKVKEIRDELLALVEPIRTADNPPEDADDAMMDTLDALAGNCRPESAYRDPPRTDLPTEGEIARLPQWARVAYAARCARRVLPLYRHFWPAAPHEAEAHLDNAISLCESVAGEGGRHPAADRAFERAYSVARSAFVADRGSAAAVAVVAGNSAAIVLNPYAPPPYAEDPAWLAFVQAQTGREASALAASAARIAHFVSDIRPYLCRDYGHLSSTARWRHWTDSDPVPVDVFGPLWPEGPPPGWPADPDLPQRADLPIELVSAARVLEQMTEDDTLRVFNAINAYYIARTGDRLTLEDLRPLIAAGVLAEV